MKTKKQFLNVLLMLIIIAQISCTSTPMDKKAPNTFFSLEGKCMGTSYHITHDAGENFQVNIDKLINEFEMEEASTYQSTSAISIFNQEVINSMNIKDYPHFKENLNLSKRIFEETKGAFDPTVMPLVNYWGFGFTEKKAVEKVDSAKVANLMEKVGFSKLLIEDKGSNTFIEKKVGGLQLDLSAVAKGYGVDMVCEYLEKNGAENYLVEIGGETRVKGKNREGNYWKIGINSPDEKATAKDHNAIIELKNEAIATSGNYRIFYEVNGKKYAHTINPYTGYPMKNNLLSASVIAKNCAMADAYATAFMVMGVDKTMSFVKNKKDLEVYLIYADENGNFAITSTPGFSGKVVN